jgi:ABC-2 type transport system permease protein
MIMPRLIVAEFQKLLTTRLWIWLLLAAMALAGLYSSLLIGFSDDPDTLTAPLHTAAGQQTLFATAAGGANTLTAVLAAIGITGEFRHRTATSTFLATPARSRVVVAKLITYAFVGFSIALACLVVVAVIAVPWLAAKDIPISLTGNGLPGIYLGVLSDAAIFGLLGVGLGALLHNQVATVVGLLVYRFVAEPVATSVPALSDWTIYLPGSASAALTQVSLSNQEYLEAWQGGLVLAGYGLTLALLGTAVAVRRDLT